MLNSTSVDEMLRFHERQDGAVDECAPGSARVGNDSDWTEDGRGQLSVSRRLKYYKLSAVGGTGT